MEAQERTQIAPLVDKVIAQFEVDGRTLDAEQRERIESRLLAMYREYKLRFARKAAGDRLRAGNEPGLFEVMALGLSLEELERGRRRDEPEDKT